MSLYGTTPFSQDNPVAGLDQADSLRTRLSDAVGYLIARELPMRSKWVNGRATGHF